MGNMQIGNVKLKNNLIAAPLAGISNPVYRQTLHDEGIGLTVSEMISDKALHFQNKKTYDMCQMFETERPVSLQLFGSDPETMKEASAFLTKNTNCDIIDINMGCPVAKVVKGFAGSHLMKDPDLAYRIVRAVKENTDRPVTVKMRIGWDHQSINAVEFAKCMEKAGVDAIAVHGRTRSDFYSGTCRYDVIKEVKENVSVPVIANGDVKTVEDYIKIKEETKCDGIMIGRGLLGRPYFVKEILAYENGFAYSEPSYEEKIDMCRQYAKRLVAYEGEHVAMCQMRGMAAWFLTGIPFGASYKARLASVNTLSELVGILDEFVCKLRG